MKKMFSNNTCSATNLVKKFCTALAPTLLASSLLLSSTAHAAQLVLRAGSPPSSKPTTFLDVKTNTIQGFMPDIIREIGKREGFKVDFQPIPFSALIPSAASGKIDLLVSGMTPTAKRAEIVDFTDVVTAFGEGLVVQASNKNSYKTAADLKGESIGVPAGADYGETLQKMGIFKEVKYYDTPADMNRDVQLGRIKGAMQDYPVLKAQRAAGALKGLRVDETYVPVVKDDIALAVKKGNKPLLDKINHAIRQMKADGTLAKIMTKWGLSSN
jgi:polar amino acid transport system substrate-binding protein